MKRDIDVIDQLLGTDASAAIRDLRGQKPELASQMQAYYDAVFDPDAESAAALSPAERCLIALRTAAHTHSNAAMDWYAARARDTNVDTGDIDRAADLERLWPANPRLHAIMRHVDLIVARPAESRKEDIEALETAGVSPAGIVALSQTVAYVSYQVRLVATFRALGESA